jgi:hypothetical protein
MYRQYALEAIRGVGDANLGQWEHWTGNTYQIRRRLTRSEQKSVGNPVDIRGTEEATRRYVAVRKYLPPEWGDLIE